MSFAHLALGSVGWRVTHAAVWVDGAEGFVFLSGLVLGITQRRAVEQAGPRFAALKLLRRTRLIYLGHLALCVLAIVVVQLNPARASYYVGLDRLGGPLPTVASLLTLRVNPYDTSMLSVYVVAMLLALPSIVLLRQGRWPAVLGVSLILFAAGTLFPRWLTLPYAPGVGVGVNWGTWQLLFVLALCAGWSWNSPRMQFLRGDRDVLGCCCAAVMGLGTLAWVVTTGTVSPWKTAVASFFTDANLGIGRIVMGLAMTVVMYHVAGWLVRNAVAVVAPFATLGRRSLDCYLILSTVVLITPNVLAYNRNGGAAHLVVLMVLVLCWGWCTLRDRRAPVGAERRDRAGSRQWTVAGRQGR